MNINDFLKQWQQSVDKAHSQQDDSRETEDLYSVAGMHTRSDINAGDVPPGYDPNWRALTNFLEWGGRRCGG